ncbi:FUSC family protein [Iodobacter fluviatilis]|uniref:Membrane protein YccC n=1 Tax=Iodobacter fluviatilis TaxID=537 RepID=A0A377Q6J9_9NEIS|nr:FUSC family protein [Iodobacter fluviatilis]TCU86999.1 putative membrane protein YccC [Iodobacter fluviatilis]STQ90330.1 p-hydroxybenzoic acid efflux pump subunit AaeB [Iodobacter fluviatilis]
MKLPSFVEISFSLKSFAAAMLALYIAFSMDLPRPFWAMLTAYIVAHPFSGAVRSKAIYRVIGTVLGSVVTLLLVPNLVNAPELLLLALALWISLCIYLSLLDRTPRSYIFLLAGYTCALIGFPSVSMPGAIFDVALARVEEITLGIVCATLIHSLILPVPVGPNLLARIDEARDKARIWILDVLKSAKDSDADRRKMAGTISELRLLATHLPFDTSRLRWAAGLVNGLCDQLALALPLLYAIEDRKLALGELPPEWQAMLNRIAAWLEAGTDAAQAGVLCAEISAITPKANEQSTWQDVLLINLATRLTALIQCCTHAAEIRRAMNQSSSVISPDIEKILIKTSMDKLHQDRAVAFRSALTAFLAITLSGAFWIASAWPSGMMAPVMAAVACSLFAALDNPAPAIKVTFILSVVTIPLSAFYLLVVLPATHSFGMLAMLMFPMFFILGIFMMRPASAFPALMTTLVLASTLALQDTAMADLNTFLNNKFGELAGVASALVATGLIRSLSGEWIIDRLLRAGWQDLAKLGKAAEPDKAFAARMIDRLGLLAPRLATLADPSPAASVLNDLRIGHEMTILIQHQEQLPLYIQPLLAQLSAYFAQRARQAIPPASLLSQLDNTLRGAIQESGSSAQLALIAALTGIRRDLFPDTAADLSHQPIADLSQQAIALPNHQDEKP